ncbi:M56 family metallopeptidase [Novosphingobium sp. RD2P27]|uniref:M56 family metallopeptidase n=1 Tax=Novosphingobium kalidii TaxID=3230299 RepID=A0ABV2D3V3_9SPHN
MIAWLTDTLIMTGALLALILLVRRPVGRWFGPGAAYALWALPMIRLFLPPLVLPESLAATRAAEALLPPAEPLAEVMPAEVLMSAPLAEAAVEPGFAMPWGTILIAVWLGGAALFLAHRVIAYRVMRRQLLADARSVGHAGEVRIVESRAVAAPVAFGVFDKVVALPRGFLATADSDASDFAITHELEHHAGKDLIANMAVQPLFALHWFNPVAWLAWRALRSDQEAACDARVMTGCTRRERERYGRLIASFAAGSKFALAAPMAGPLKGDKPIIHRLKALVRNEEAERHPLLGRSLFAASVIAVPLTATVTYAADEVAEPEAQTIVHAAPAARAAPAADAAPLLSMAFTEDPATVTTGSAKASLITIKHGLDETCADAEETAHRQTVVRHGKRFQILTPHRLSTDEIDRVVENALVRAELGQRHAERTPADVERAERFAEKQAARAERLAEQQAERAERLAEQQAARAEEHAERTERLAEQRAERAEREAERAERQAEQEAERAERLAERSVAAAGRTARIALAGAPKVEQSFSSDGKVQTLRFVTRFADGRPALTRTMVIDGTCAADRQVRSDGKRAVTRVCTGASDTTRHIAAAFAQARASIVNAPISAPLRAEILSELGRDMAHARARLD